MSIQVQDSNPFSIGLSSDEGPICARSNSVLFPKGLPIPSVKILTFQRSNLFHLEAFYANLNELPPGTSPKISCFTVCPLWNILTILICVFLLVSCFYLIPPFLSTVFLSCFVQDRQCSLYVSSLSLQFFFFFDFLDTRWSFK